MTQPTVPARGIIFDFDGVLIDSEPFYLRSVNVILAECGAPQLSREEYQEHIGSTARLTWEALAKRNNFPDPPSSYQDRYEVVLEGVLQDELQLRPEAEALLATIAGIGVKRGLATASRRKWMALKLEKLGLVDYFDAAVCSTTCDEPSRPRISISWRLNAWAFQQTMLSPLRTPPPASGPQRRRASGQSGCERI